MTILEFNKTNLPSLRSEITEALNQIAKKHSIQFSVGNISFNSNLFTCKLTSTVGAASTNSKESSSKDAVWKADFLSHALDYGFTKSDFGKSFVFGGIEYTVIGMRPRAKHKMVVRSADGKCKAFEESMVKNYLKLADEAAANKPVIKKSATVKPQKPEALIAEQLKKIIPLYKRLSARWDNEHQYEDINDYGIALQIKMPKGFKVVKMVKRAFKCIFTTLDNKKFCMYLVDGDLRVFAM